MPIDPESFIPQTHLVRIIDKIIDKIDTSHIVQKYKGGGTSSYHPLMLLKVLIYAYIQGIYSSRKIAKALEENITFMWLSKLQTPDFRTINRFRKEIIFDCIEGIFAEVIELLVKLWYVNFEYYYLDKTKIEANASKYTIVWTKSTRTYKKKLREKVKNIFDEIERINEEEDRTLGELDVGLEADYDSKELEQKVEKLTQKLAKASFENKRKERRVKKLVKLRLKKYESYEQILNGRNSFSKTDNDATYIEDEGRPYEKWELKAGYNVQIGTQNQFVIGFSIHQSSTDTVCLKEHLELVEKIIRHKPKNIVANSDYGSEENYLYLKKCGINSYIKYNTFDLEQTRRFKKDIFKVKNWEYIPEEDIYICPAGKRIKYLYSKVSTNERGFVSYEKVYQCEEICNGCKYRDRCYNGKRWKKRFSVRLRIEKLKEEVRQRLLSEEGKKIYRKRKIEVETVFGIIKNNKGFRRFLLRGLKGVKLK